MKIVAGEMARKKKTKRFDAVQAVKELARERVGAPPVEKVVPHKNKKAEKHKAYAGEDARRKRSSGYAVTGMFT